MVKSKRLPSKTKTVRKVVPVSLITITDVYKKNLEKKLKPKYAKNLSNKVVFEIIMLCMKDISEEDVIKKVPKKYLR